MEFNTTANLAELISRQLANRMNEALRKMRSATDLLPELVDLANRLMKNGLMYGLGSSYCFDVVLAVKATSPKELSAVYQAIRDFCDANGWQETSSKKDCSPDDYQEMVFLARLSKQGEVEKRLCIRITEDGKYGYDNW